MGIIEKQPAEIVREDPENRDISLHEGIYDFLGGKPRARTKVEVDVCYATSGRRYIGGVKRKKKFDVAGLCIESASIEDSEDRGKHFGAVGPRAALGSQDVVLPGVVEEQLETQE
ncbi:hypothetical protein WN51_01740 [Melipona quadrifasciata]|uniref:Uncharacterized protein n=1 Tax=Melipona quadrifasciata TaxID=166423 RepID=A0A0M8ZWG9_9HYME|nr:hypothetical protein WN51_01740 [Melipona quadrifasciata]